MADEPEGHRLSTTADGVGPLPGSRRQTGRWGRDVHSESPKRHETKGLPPVPARGAAWRAGLTESGRRAFLELEFLLAAPAGAGEVRGDVAGEAEVVGLDRLPVLDRVEAEEVAQAVLHPERRAQQMGAGAFVGEDLDGS